MFTYTAFNTFDCVAKGSLADTALAMKGYSDQHPNAQLLVFSDSTGRQIDLDLSGTQAEILNRLKLYTSPSKPSETTVGRPKLGVFPREISLQSEHWEWLLNQEGGASSAIRKLIDAKIKGSVKSDVLVKEAQERTYKFLSAIAGNLPRFEEVIRFLYRKDKEQFEGLMSGWPGDVVGHAKVLADGVWG